MVWTFDIKLQNNTGLTLIPRDPSYAMWYGYSTGGPQQAKPNQQNNAGSFASPENEAVGITGMVVYKFPDSNATIQLLFMMPHTGKNILKVGQFWDSDPVDLPQVKRMWNDDQFQTSKTFTIKVNGADATFTISGKVDPKASNAVAEFTLERA